MGRPEGAAVGADRTKRVESAARVRHRVVIFVVVAYVGAWLVCLPLWLSGRGLVTVDLVLSGYAQTLRDLAGGRALPPV
ncbi:MAG: hypothetical protein ACR2LI_06565 [Propionibacteriaceae bacterium]